MKYLFIIILTLFTLHPYAETKSDEHIKQFQEFKQVYMNALEFEVLTIDDPISDKPINTEIFKLFDSNKNVVGFVRDINTTTGCNSACLPVVFTLYFDSKLNLIRLKSLPGLTKKNHVPFSDKDYERLNFILAINPEIFKTVNHPTEMVDAITGATKSEFVESVVKEAAYTSLRVNRYFQHTLNFLKKLNF